VKRPPRRRWSALAGVVLVAALWFGGPALGRRMDFFRIRRVEFAGMRHLKAAVTLPALGLGREASIFDDLRPIAARAAQIGGVERAEAGRRFPGTLIVRIRETPPVALVPRNGRLVLMDSAGRVLPYDPAHSAPDLPIAATPDGRVGRLLRRMQRLDPALFARVETTARAGDDVVLMVDGRRLLFRPEASVEEMRAVMAVAQDLAQKREGYTELDGRFAGYVVVRGTGA
jgi:cell division septal protein FtsQ